MPSEKKLSNLIEEGVRRGLYDNAVLVIGNKNGSEILRENIGREPYFDVSSLTKIFVTGPAVCQYLIDAKIRNLSDQETLATLFPKGSSGLPWIGKLSLKEILQHRSGLRNWRAFFLTEKENLELYLENEAFRSFFFEKQDVYSDIGIILISHLLRKETGKTVFDIVKEKVSAQIFDQHFKTAERIGRTVHDDNARFFNAEGSWSGHAGLFCSREIPLSSLTHIFFQTEPGAMMRAPDAKNTRLVFRDGSDPLTRVFGNGGSYGHYGFTGAFFWIDPSTEKIAFLMTDRFKKSFSPSPEWKSHRTEILRLCDEVL